MAEEIESPANEPDRDATSVTRRVRHRKTPARPTRPVAPVKTTPAPSSVRPAVTAPKKPNRVMKPLRSLVILSMVGGMVATVAIPAFAAARPSDEAVTLQQMAVDDAQTFVAASDANATELSRESYSATTSEEIEKKKAAEAAAERARLAAQVASSQTQTRFSVDLNMVAPGSGEVRWPLANYTLGEGFGTRGGAHMGVDMLAPAGTPIFAAAAGVVKVSQESYGGYGVAVTIDHVIGGQRVGTLYGHMTYGSRTVVPGQTVEAGQLIGLVGSTGRSTANHLHFETYINGSNVDPYAWLQSNAG
ncbi:peptidoglycan DD-metalloendopeptidase family protein [Microbacterium sp. CFH 90308]|uniref:Peptidoglycan DD-metalloendopeptidase family protein n=1 Tax=Microbacterium salsuginis TaxID=2722803 RepID=A0ABX1K6C5_9MICO|nr:M23 family metallopeptidase [Microbacterium sp. CFH 90308]NLP82527.1 peptidoglycan DD-metalloendopeptidase family protein [Microbacterium sp. CFH 90308]